MTAARRSVVLVDDAEEVRTLIHLALRRSGRYEVVGEGSDGLEAIERATEHRPDVLVLDVSMPRMDGLEALPKIIAESPETRVVLYSGFDESGLADRARELGAAGFIRKSTAVLEFADELDRVLLDLPAPEPVPEPDEVAPAALPGASDLDVGVLDEHLERFREVFEEAAIGMGTLTLTGRLVRANKELGRLVGRPVEDLVGEPYFDHAAGVSAATVHAALTAHMSGTDVTQIEHKVVVRNRVRRLSTTLAVARDSQRRPLYFFVQAQDITAQRHAEEALRSSEERFALLVEAVEDYAIFMLDTGGHVASWNSGAQRIKGYTADEIIGSHFRVFYPPEKQSEQHPEHELQIALAEGHYEEEGWRVRKDGTQFWANVVISAVRNQTGEHIGFAKVTRDITERRERLREEENVRLELAEANVRLAEAVAEQTQFVAVTSHELRNPISVLTGACTLLMNEWDDLTDDERAGMFESIKSSAARMNRLLNDLLTASRLESGRMDLHVASVDVARLLESVAATAVRANAQADIAVDCPVGLRVEADRDRLAQAIENLLLNSLRHGAGQVELSARQVDGSVELRVSDSGLGVPESVLPRLFDRFATGRRPGGTGLGLFIVRELARAHGGDVRYEPGERPTFVLTLPENAAAA